MYNAPQKFDVIVTDNMFGDIITNLDVMIQGEIGVVVGENIKTNSVSIYKPIDVMLLNIQVKI